MAQSIDFLPASYRQTQHRRHKRVWRRGALAVVLLGIVVGSFHQRRTCRTLQNRRDKLQQQAAAMTADLPETEALERRLRHLEARADLVTLLRLRARPTRILAVLADNLPGSTTLRKLHCWSERAGGTSRQRASRGTEAENPQAEQRPYERDVDRLRQRRRETALLVEIHGLAPDDVAVSEYLSALEASGVFGEVRLRYTDQHDFRSFPLRDFGIRLRVTPLERGRPAVERAQLAAYGPGGRRNRPIGRTVEGRPGHLK